MSKKFSLFRTCLFIPCLLYSLFFWLLCYYDDDDYFWRGTQKDEGEKMEFELFCAFRHLSFSGERDGDVINGVGYHRLRRGMRDSFKTMEKDDEREAVCGKHARETHTDT